MNSTTLLPRANARVVVVQDGARRHYGVPLAIQQAGCLERVYTTWYAPPHSLSRLTARVLDACHFKPAANMLHRYSPHLDNRRVFSRGWITLYEKLFRKRFASNLAHFNWCSKQITRWVKRHGFGDANTFFGFITNAPPDLFAYARSKGLLTIGDQFIAPFDVQLREDELQRARFPGWSSDAGLAAERYWGDIEAATWPHLDHIVCGSDYVRDGLISVGINPGKVSTLPYPINADDFLFVDRSKISGPLRVGFVGTVGLRKGAPYFLEVAKRFAPDTAEFTMIGPLDLTPMAVEQMQPHVKLTGPVPRREIIQRLHDFDVFFFPSTCEGSAGSVREAMATGLPIITSPNAGSIVEHGVSGFLAPYDDIDAHVRAIETLRTDPEKRAQMALAARAAVEKCSIAAHRRQWQELFARLSAVGQPV